MRKAQKTQLLEILHTLEEAHEAIRQYIGRRELETARALLSDCQQSALQIGAIIEESEGEDCPAVGLLETYCESLYQVTVGIPEAVSAQKAYKTLDKAILRVKNRVTMDIPVRLEIVFLPYKASMWDSFESVWRAADADPNCDAYVIPIPYYDRNPDGSLGKFFYEGGKFPENVPVVRYDSYDFENRRPDAVFIHNGYDSYNYITSVHPSFYTTQIKKFTEALLYIPYFISVHSVSESMCTVPGCWNADRVFLQSENIRREYISAFRKLRPPAGFLENFEKKFIALGSPKFDKAILSRPEEFALPGQWEKLLKNSGGTSKKIVLYNTTVTAMLQGNEKYLLKLRMALEAFRSRSDVVLWWRPHPLSESTFRSMRPHLLPEFLRIAEDYRQGGWGIFDNTADVDRAVAYADYYYGDAGSALQASFQAAGKPVMLQRIDPAGERLVCPLVLGASEEKVYFSPVHSSAILSLDFSTHKIEAVRHGRSTVSRRYCRGAASGGALYFTPVSADSILKLELETQQFHEIPYELDEEQLMERYPQYQKGWNFSWSFSYGDEVFFLGVCPLLMCLHTRSNQVSYITNWPDIWEDSGNSFVINSCCQMEGQLAIGGTSSVIVCFDMASKRFSTERIPHECASNGFSTMAYGDGYLWLMAKNDGTILRFSPMTKEVAVYNNFPAEVLRCEDMCCASVYIRGELWLFSNNTNAVLRLKAETGEISVVRLFSAAEKSKAVHLSLPVLVDGKICVSRMDHPGIAVYDPETAACVDIPIQASAEIAGAVSRGSDGCEPMDIYDTVLLENGIDTIETLLGAQVEDRERLLAEWIASPDGRAGERIYQYVKEMLVSGET